MSYWAAGVLQKVAGRGGDMKGKPSAIAAVDLTARRWPQ